MMKCHDALGRYTCTRRDSCLGSLLRYDEARSHARENTRPHNISALARISAPWQLDSSMFVYLCVCGFETPATQVFAFWFQSLIIALFKSHIKTVEPNMTWLSYTWIYKNLSFKTNHMKKYLKKYIKKAFKYGSTFLFSELILIPMLDIYSPVAPKDHVHREQRLHIWSFVIHHFISAWGCFFFFEHIVQ